MGHIDKLAAFVAETQWEHIPERVRQHGRLVMLDTLGVILAGSEQPEVSRLRTGLLATGGTGATILARGYPVSDPRTAALINGIAGRSIELCEGHRFVACQAAVQVLPGVLALAEQTRGNGRDILTALILGYEVAARMSLAFTPRKLAHQNGQGPLLGGVAGGARSRRFDALDTSLAMRIGATLMLTPSYTNAIAGATVLNVAGGMSGAAGVLATELVLAGFVARSDAIEESLSHLVGDGFQPEMLLNELGTRWEITRNAFRLRACCNPIYASLDALEAALADLHARPDEIDRIDVATFAFASTMRNPDPPNYFAAKYSLPHAAAALIVTGSAGYGAFTETMVHDPVIASLRKRVNVVEDPALTAMFPKLKPARVTVTLTDGRNSTRYCESARGDFQRPYEESELRQKFRELAGLLLTAEGAAKVEQLVDDCERWQSLDQLTRLLRLHAAADR